MLVTLTGRTIALDGRPDLVLAGEIHYFRLLQGDWAQRLDLLVEAGADTVASYIPWVVHELADGSVDLTGRTRPELDLGAFIDLAARKGLRFLARPGPFTMGELRREGIPGRLTRQHPEILPVTWDGAAGPTGDVDVLAPAFLEATRIWYAHVGTVLAPRMAGLGGPVLGVQLDNEIGMLSWVSNSPVLTDLAVTELLGRLGPDGGAATAAAIRSPSPASAAALRVELGRYFRERSARYVAVLRGFAVESGFGGVPLLINVHGTEAGSASSFPIGISQLAQSYRDIPGMASGSDHYLGNLTFPGAAELHLAHAFLAAVNGADQPLTSLEFEAGNGDYGSGLGSLTDPAAVVLKIRLLLSQGVRLVNWYLFAGGTNFLDPRPEDAGTHRFGITGERHGNAAPVTPEGERGDSFAATAESMSVAAAHRRWAADWEPEHDDLVFGFVLDHYATEYAYGGNPVMPELVAELARARGGGPGSLLPRALLGAGFRYGAVDVQCDLPSTVPRLIVLGSPALLDAAVQHRLLEHVRAGGSMLLLGAMPTLDHAGRDCTVLADALGLTVAAPVTDGIRPFLSVVGAGTLSRRAETRVGRLQPLLLTAGVPLLRDAITGDVCAAEIPCGGGLITVVATDYAAEPGFFAHLVARLGVTPGLRSAAHPSALITATTRTPAGDRFLHLINPTGFTLSTDLTLDDRALFGGRRITVPPATGRILPLRLTIGDHRISEGNAEIIRVAAGSITFRAVDADSAVTVDGRQQMRAGAGEWTVPLTPRG